jgi:hypothetical protein
MMEEMCMDEIFIKKVRTAAIAGWWTLLIVYCPLLISWFSYLLIMNRQPEGMLCLWGKGFTWAEIRTIWSWGMLAYKLSVAILLFVVIWLTLWARQLAKK